MISTKSIAKCSTLSTEQLQAIIRKDYPEDLFMTSEFLGINRDQNFVYKVSYPCSESKTGIGTSKVFVWENHLEDLVADYQ